ncbi:hypothetical protein [Arthrobacter sp. M4]|uniref:hypothetical protein n=1 Tax=Arthrobacter sp. M4 TaxID=218160 RepID=UPI001CDCBC8D|nr:hypothetical protein [Arthrobacter sp. M4]MCA4133149.1 hypothetical protein [Arthrobacter sp. M4]
MNTPRATKWLFIIAGALGAVAVFVIAYIWIGSQVFGINTSRLDPSQGPAWPMNVVVWPLIGALSAAAVGIVLAIAGSQRISVQTSAESGAN